MFEIGDLLTLSDNKEYIVIKEVNFEDKKYLFLIGKDGMSDFSIFKYENEELEIVDDAELTKKLIERFEEK